MYISLLELELAFINFLYVFFARHLLMSFYLFVLSTLFCRWLFLLTMPFFVILRLELDWHLSKSISHKTCQLCISIRAQEIHFYSFLKMLMKNQIHCFKLHRLTSLISYRIICQFNSSNLLPAVKWLKGLLKIFTSTLCNHNLSSNTSLHPSWMYCKE